MFENSLVESKVSGARKASTLFLSSLAHVALVATLLVIPLLVTDALPAGGGGGWGKIMLAPGRGGESAPPPAAPAPGHRTTSTAVNSVRTVAVAEPAIELLTTDVPHPVVENPLITLPTHVPYRIEGLQALAGDDGPEYGKDGGKLGGLPNGVPNGTGTDPNATGTCISLLGCGPGNGSGGGGRGPGIGFGPGGDGVGIGQPTAPPPLPVARVVTPPVKPVTPPPPPPPPPVTPPPPVIRVGSGPQAANCIKCPAPEYPDLARKARVQDTVVLQALINKEGTIEGLSVVTGNQLFHKAALEAVRQWKYRPTLLNGEPVAVQTTISIAFVLK